MQSLDDLGLSDQRYIEAHALSKVFPTEHGRTVAVNHVSFTVHPGERLGILGPNGSGKSTLIKILAGILAPTSGYVHRGLTLSWPLALTSGFEGQLTGYDNVRFLSKLYGMGFRETFDYVTDFSELGRHIHTPVRFYSDGMRMRLAFALSLAMNFECYLIDEVILVGDRRFQLKCHDELFSRRKHCGMIIAVHDAGIIKEYCGAALLMKDGRGRLLHDLNLAARIYQAL